jgi:hypothetical protein
MYTISVYSKEHNNKWNEFVAKSKNGTFLFHRDFMEYHSDRFKDFSLLVFRGQTLVALLPAHVRDNAVYSHWGLTYGGLILSEKIKLQEVIGVFREVLLFLKEGGVEKLYIKTIPHIYHRFPAEELEYALFLVNAKLIRRDSLAVIENSKLIKIASNRMEGVKRGITNGFKLKESHDPDFFWDNILIPALKNRHNATPVHTLEEIKRLKSLFPAAIRFLTVINDDGMAAGTVIFETDTVAHAQYIAANDDKNKTGSLDFLYHEIITKLYSGKKYFDFGISNEEQGRKLNSGLSFWKESFGARTVVHDFYEVETGNFGLLENVLK